MGAPMVGHFRETFVICSEENAMMMEEQRILLLIEFEHPNTRNGVLFGLFKKHIQISLPMSFDHSWLQRNHILD